MHFSITASQVVAKILDMHSFKIWNRLPAFDYTVKRLNRTYLDLILHPYMQLFLNFMDGPGPLLCYNCQSHRCRSFHSITNSFLCPSKSTIQKKCDNFRSRVITFTFFLPSYRLNNHHLCVEIKSLFLISWQVEEETKNFLFIETHLAGVFLKENFKDRLREECMLYWGFP